MDKARFNFAIETLAYVLPDSSPGGKYDLILGSDEIRKYDLLTFLSGDPKPFAKLPEVPEAREVIENGGSEGEIEIDEDHLDMLNATSTHWNAVASIFQNKFTIKGDGVTQTIDCPPEDRWKGKICDSNLPPGSAIRTKLEGILNRYLEKGVITNRLDGRIITEQPLHVDPKPGVLVKGKPGRKYPDTIVEAIRVWLKLMQDHDIIQPSLSKTSSPLLVVKQDGKYRFTCDNTDINKSINTIHGAIPSLDRIVRWLSTKKYKSVLDLLKA